MAEQDNEREVRIVDGIEQQSRPSEADWNPDSFPTSAKPIFRAGALLVGLVVALCFATYSCSDHTPTASETKTPKAAPVENPLEGFEGEE